MESQYFVINDQDEALAKVQQDFPDCWVEFRNMLDAEYARQDDELSYYTILTDEPINTPEPIMANGATCYEGYSYLVLGHINNAPVPLFGLFLSTPGRTVHLVKFKSDIVRH